MRVFLVDNYDSFTYNLAQLIREHPSAKLKIRPSDQIQLDDLVRFDKFVFSPGPGLPKDNPIMFQILTEFQKNKSFLGVCLGHQAIAEHYGATLYNQKRVVHGISKKAWKTEHHSYLFERIKNGFDVGLYHSWAVSKTEFPEDLHVTLESEDGIIMGIQHQDYDVHGIQFHPESIMTKVGKSLIFNWLNR